MHGLHPLCFLLATFAGWVNRHQAQTIDYLIEENRVLKEQFGKRQLRLTDSVRTAKPGDPGAKPPAETSPPSGDVLEFELGGRAVVQRRVDPRSVVESPDVLEDARRRERTGVTTIPEHLATRASPYPGKRP